MPLVILPASGVTDDAKAKITFDNLDCSALRALHFDFSAGIATVLVAIAVFNRLKVGTLGEDLPGLRDSSFIRDAARQKD